jgi:flagellar protein FlaG
MSTDITAVNTPHIPTGLKTPPPKVADQAEASAAKSVSLPEKPQINFDPAEAQRHLHEAVERLNEQMKKGAYNLNFTVDSVTDQVVVKVRNTQTGDVIRQLPNEAVLRFAHNLEDLKGLLSDEKT